MEDACNAVTWFCTIKAYEPDPFLLIAMLFLAFFTARLFLSTRKMAEKTADLANGTVEANQLADRHYQEGLMPLVTLLRDFSEDLRTHGVHRAALVSERPHRASESRTCGIRAEGSRRMAR
jgi:hypothetical protein